MLKRSLLTGLSLTCLLCSCATDSGPAPQSTPPPPPEFRHTVRYQGETLAAISRWYTGTSSQWQAIRDANPSLDPRKLKPGIEIVIPHELLVRTDPFPRPTASQSAKKKEEEVVARGPGSPGAEVANSDSPPASGAQEPPSDGDAGTVNVAAPDQPLLGGAATTAPSVNSEPEDDANSIPQPPPQNQSGSVVGGILEAVGKIAIENEKQGAAPAK